MKKLLTFIVSSALALSLAACNGQSTAAENTNAAAEAAEEVSAETLAEENVTEAVSEGGVLVAYFSWSGNTEQMAQIIAEETGADLFEIAPDTPYTDDYDELLDIAQEEQSSDARPAIADTVELSGYDTVYLGFPNWWGDMPMIIYTFLDEYDLSGKTIAPFNTSGGSGFSDSLDTIAEMEPDAEITEGLSL